MSTKIYNGYEIQIKNATLRQLTTFISEVQKDIRSACLELMSRKAADIATEIIDGPILLASKKYTIAGTEFEEWTWRSPASFADNLLRDKYKKIKTTMQRDPEYDFEFEVCFMPCDERTLALLYVEQEKYTSIWENHPKVKDYHYQNQTDRPKGISKAEWEERSISWDKALAVTQGGGSGAAGLSMHTFGHYGIPFIQAEDILKYMPTLEQRARKFAVNILLNEKCMELAKADPDERSIIGRVLDAEDWLRNEGKSTLVSLTKELQAKLKPVLILDDLLARKKSV